MTDEAADIALLAVKMITGIFLPILAAVILFGKRASLPEHKVPLPNLLTRFIALADTVLMQHPASRFFVNPWPQLHKSVSEAGSLPVLHGLVYPSGAIGGNLSVCPDRGPFLSVLGPVGN